MIFYFELEGFNLFLHLGLHLKTLGFPVFVLLQKKVDKGHREGWVNCSDDPSYEYLITNIEIPIRQEIIVLIETTQIVS